MPNFLLKWVNFDEKQLKNTRGRALKKTTKNPLDALSNGFKGSGRKRTRTIDPYDVNVVL